MTQTNNQTGTWKQYQASDKARRKRQQELNEMAFMAYMAGTAGNGYAMDAAAEMVNG
jgi:hypothetical protein